MRNIHGRLARKRRQNGRICSLSARACPVDVQMLTRETLDGTRPRRDEEGFVEVGEMAL